MNTLKEAQDLQKEHYKHLDRKERAEIAIDEAIRVNKEKMEEVQKEFVESNLKKIEEDKTINGTGE